MPKITFITPAGESRTIDAAGSTADSLMELALDHKVSGIEGSCGGVLSCGTCHVHVDPAHTAKVGDPSPTEADLLELDDHRGPTSRCSCQIKLGPGLDGLVIRVAGQS